MVWYGVDLEWYAEVTVARWILMKALPPVLNASALLYFPKTRLLEEQ